MNRLKDYRVKKRMTQKELAKASGVCQVTISQTENDRSEPMDRTKLKLAKPFGVPANKIFLPKEKRTAQQEKETTAQPNCLRDCRIKKLMSQKELAAASGISQVTISFIENQLSEPMELTKQKLARALKVAPEKLFPPKKQKKITVRGIRQDRI
ncbi:MAG: helix-turn-helix transcriptional regulator [Patescibacteria group bacterium]